MIARTALCAGLLLPAAGHADRNPPPPFAEHKVYIEVHGQNISWNGKPVRESLSLEAKCRALRGRMAGVQFTVASGIDTSQFQVRRIVKTLRKACGASYVTYDILVRLTR